MREHGALHIPDIRAQKDFPMMFRGCRRIPSFLGGGLAHLFERPPSSAEGTRWCTDRASHRGAPLYPGTDQAA